MLERVIELYELQVSNLSILECKLFDDYADTYGVDTFLIYPYWNVNNGQFNILEAGEVVSNLSILECKQY